MFLVNSLTSKIHYVVSSKTPFFIHYLVFFKPISVNFLIAKQLGKMLIKNLIFYGCSLTLKNYLYGVLFDYELLQDNASMENKY